MCHCESGKLWGRIALIVGDERDGGRRRDMIVHCRENILQVVLRRNIARSRYAGYLLGINPALC